MASTNEDNRSNDDSVDRPLRVCFVVLGAYPAIEPRVSGGIGGIETRSWMFAKSLSERAEFDVSFVIRTPQRVLESEYSGVKLLPIYDRFSQIRTEVSRSVKRKAGFPWLSFSEFRWRLLWQLPLLAIYEPFRPVLHSKSDPSHSVKLFTEIEADVLVGFGVNVVTAAVIASAKPAGKKSVLFIASDIDLDERYTADSEYVNIYQSPVMECHYAIMNADRIVVQTPLQLQMLEQNFGRSGVVIGNPIDLEEWDRGLKSAELPAAIDETDGYVLWVGRAERNQKQPQLMPELARRCPDLNFLMIMNPGDDELAEEVLQAAPENLKIINQVPFVDMPAVYRHASVLVNTSDSEGFPNTFLQAVASRVPIVSLKVCEQYLRESQAGECAGGSIDQMADIVRDISASRTSEQSDAARDYVRQHHGLQNAVTQIAERLKKL